MDSFSASPKSTPYLLRALRQLRILVLGALDVRIPVMHSVAMQFWKAIFLVVPHSCHFPASSACSAFDVKIVRIKNPTDKARLKISYKRNKRWSDWAELSEGCYLLRTDLTNIDPKTLWKRYIRLTEAEWAFRVVKDELVIRPIWHQKADRVKAHILVCFLAYVLWKTLAQWMRRAGLGDAPRTLLEEFAKVKSADVVLPARSSNRQVSKTIRLRCVTTPDEAQKVLLNRLGLILPQRLRRIDKIAQI